MTPVRLHHTSSDIPDTKCLFEKGTLLHCLWECNVKILLKVKLCTWNLLNGI